MTMKLFFLASIKFIYVLFEYSYDLPSGGLTFLPVNRGCVLQGGLLVRPSHPASLGPSTPALICFPATQT